MTGDGPSISLEVADDFSQDAPAGVELRLRLEEWVRGDEVHVTWNGRQLTEPVIDYCTGGDPNPISDVSSAVWQRYQMPAADVTPGTHLVKAVARNRHPQVASDLVLSDVELVVTY